MPFNGIFLAYEMVRALWMFILVEAVCSISLPHYEDD
jgi:energy-converting hydrogenase Eha subunit E